MKSLTYCFDIDGTICKTVRGSYDESSPFSDRIQVINSLYNLGHRIILFTARGTTTGIDWRNLTEKQLEEWGVLYHVLLLGKPEADVYVDDRGTNADDFEWVVAGT